MGKKKGEGNPNPSDLKEGHNLLGAPAFEQLENGRLKCLETGHELPAHARDSYADSKHCRLGLINSALARKNPPLNMFKQDAASSSKLKCRLTGVTINKTEEHIWKHINGKRFLNRLEKKEAGEEIPNGEKKEKEKNDDGGLKGKEEKKKKKKKAKKIEKEEEPDVDEIMNGVRDPTGDSEDEDDFWMPPAGLRWDHDDGGDRWDSGSESDGDDDSGEEGMVDEEAKLETAEISRQTKRMPLEIGPSSFTSRKKKKKKTEDE